MINLDNVSYNFSSERIAHDSSRVSGKRWQHLQSAIESVVHLSKNARPGVLMMQPQYWTEIRSIEFNGRPVRPYFHPQLFGHWKRKHQAKISYHNYVKVKLKQKTIDLESINTIYFNDDEIENVKSSLTNGVLFRHGHQIRPGVFMFVLTLKNDLLVTTKRKDKLGRIHHSSLARGRPVRCAGVIKVDSHGRIIRVEGKSGHYRPGKEQLAQFIEYLAANGVSLTTLSVVEHGAKTGTRADHWLKVTGNCQILK